MSQTIRIGNKVKSVRIKRYMFDFYILQMGYTEELGMEEINKIYHRGIELIGPKCVDADYLHSSMLVEINLSK